MQTHRKMFSQVILKRPAAIFAACLVVGFARADLILEQQSSDTNSTTHMTLKLHGDQMRMDQEKSKSGGLSVIIDLKSRDSITLLVKDKKFLKRSGAESQQRIIISANPTNNTSEMDSPPAAAVATGKTEKVGDFDTELYTWSGAHGLTSTLWVATNYPNYSTIRAELAKVDRFNYDGKHRNGQPELSRLPGMVIKSVSLAKGQTVTVNLLSAKVEPVAESTFALPSDYSRWEPPVKMKP